MRVRGSHARRHIEGPFGLTARTLVVIVINEIDRGDPRRSASSDGEDRTAAEPLGRGAVAQDQLAHHPAATRIAIVERLRQAGKRGAADRDVDEWVGKEVAGPRAVGRAGGNENRAVGLGDEPDRDQAQLPGSPAARPQPRKPVVGGQVGVESGRAIRAPGETVSGSRAAGRRVVVGSRQRPRCQDLPSVATDGA